MIKRTETMGYVYISPKTNREYDLLEGVSLGGKTTSDIVFIFDYQLDIQDSHGKIVGFFYGANVTEEKDLEEIVAYYVEEYEESEE